ncbi:septal ring lytic transglycosylase RlpA family protein [Allorhizocola rhizosphaerae]|uniref:septal ring lytic transglycosylase RlpA family protein n=1 Tax=Allorhizocola rhizosphaerae TaxID=1872709 RepID=UPI001B8AFE91|nr:septal ring lytic transglycosylase RlpA family protein [Allorhizocola rhizosphaerae]
MSGSRRRLTTATLATAIIVGGTSLGLVKVASQEESLASVPVEEVEAEPSPIATTERPEPPAARSRERESSPTPSATSRSCGASFYWEPQPTASGERFDPEAMTAAHKTLPFNTMVRVTNPGNGKSVVVRINDRGPYIDGRCLDLSRGAFRQIANLETGVLKVVHYEVLAR